MASESEDRTGLFALGIELDGAFTHPVAWRARVQAAENAGFTFATFGDSLDPPESGARLDATVRAGFVAATTSTLGLVPVIAATYAEPFHLASQLATLDYASRGRAGWLAADDPATARAWGAAPRTTAAEIRRERVDSIEVARRLWDSWEDDAVIRDFAAGKFLDRDKLHHIDFIGETFAVKGPAIVPRPPQGQVVVFGYGTGESEGIDVALVSGATTEAATTAIETARAAGISRVLVDIAITLDDPAAPAREHPAASAREHPSPSEHPTAPTQEHPTAPTQEHPTAPTQEHPTASAREHPAASGRVHHAELDQRPDAERSVGTDSSGRLTFSGTAADLVGLLTQLSEVADGVRLHPTAVDADLPVLAHYVLPALLRSGLAHRPVPGSTLRANLGLPRPANRYAKELAR
ncbi:LLM class flavin-dependent oxidoreductase [Nocardia yunnanensis]|uniref:LLM class flavin-dependent oxidoreductase n=1 Tax=Nocardia yunnanensis TaxID=2382165 RepID=UPI001FE7F6E1|nr:LLM class flavin-dependent oxidoreductase [Nocardia yunnanensis]